MLSFVGLLNLLGNWQQAYQFGVVWSIGFVTCVNTKHIKIGVYGCGIIYVCWHPIDKNWGGCNIGFDMYDWHQVYLNGVLVKYVLQVYYWCS